jgi:CubicO group peptidase (beta-lactamase class C family)
LWPDLVTSIGGKDYETYLKENFYNKLGASTLTYKPLRYFSKDRIIPTEKDTFFRKQLLHGIVHDEGAAMMDGISSNAGLFSNANDLAKLFQMYLNEGTYGGEQLIAANSINTFTKTHFAGANNRRGLGFDKPLLEYHPVNSSTAQDASLNSFGHSGYTGTFVWADPDHDLIYIFFSNRVHPTRNNRKIYQMNIRPKIHQIIYDAILKK